MEPRKAVGWLAAVVIIGALIAGFSPVHADGVSCGSAIGGASDDASVAQFGEDIGAAMRGSVSDADFEAACDDRLGTQRAFVFPLLIVGALVGGYLVLTNSPAEKSARAESDRAADGS